MPYTRNQTPYKESAYSKKLRDPRWQKMRLQIMERDEFVCQSCFDGESTLNVHHRYYEKGASPWDYPAEALVTLCEACHQYESEAAKAMKSNLWNAFCRKGFLADNIEHITTCVLESPHIQKVEDHVAASIIGFALNNKDAWDALCAAYWSDLSKRRGE